MRIISISGLDGSGKSTQAKMLQEYFEKNNKKVFYFHAVQFSVPQAVKSFLKINKSLLNSTSAGEKPGITKAGWLAINLRKFAFVLDVLRFHFFKKKLAKNGFDFLVTDRYFYDTIVNIAYLQHRNTPPRIEKYIPIADAAFYLKIQPEAIMTRDRVPEQGLQYLKDKKRLYDMYANIWNFQILDGSESPRVIFDQILGKLKNT